MLIPQWRLLAVIGAWGGVALIAAFAPGWSGLWRTLGAIVLGAAGADAWLARQAAAGLALRREAPAVLPVGSWHTVVLVLAASRRALSGVVRDRVPDGAEAEHETQTF